MMEARPYDPERLRRRILGNRLVTGVLGRGDDIHIVGGYVRDLLCRGTHSRDIDFVVKKGLRKLARHIAQELGGTAVELRRERMIRVALEGGATLDFSLMQGRIDEDLAKRDFTVNALAWSPASGLIDPLNGLRDIEKGIIRAVSRQSLRSDPLRALRAYRFSAELSWPIEQKTRQLIRAMSSRLARCASERITLEFFKLLNSETPEKALGEALSDGVLKQIIPLNNNKLALNIKLLSKLRGKLEKSHLKYYLREYSQGLDRRGLLRLDLLMLGADADDARLSLSRSISRHLHITGRLYERFREIHRMSPPEAFELFSEADEAVYDLLVLAGRNGRLRAEADRFFRLQKKPIASAEEIASVTGATGPRLGRLIRELRRLQFEGAVKRKRDALGWLKRP